MSHKDFNSLKQRLDAEVTHRDRSDELSDDRPDPIMVAKEYEDEYISLICALFAYGNAKQIVKFLNSLDFSLLEKDEDQIEKALSKHYYRFQNPKDVAEFFITLKRAKESFSLNEKFLEGYQKDNLVLKGLNTLITALSELNSYDSHGYSFLLSKPPTKSQTSPYKRWNMYLRWMVRRDSLDMGLWSGVNRADLIIPLDTHTFNVSKRLGLLNRRNADLKAALELTDKLREFDSSDPVKYDFAIYRLGQEKMA